MIVFFLLYFIYLLSYLQEGKKRDLNEFLCDLVLMVKTVFPKTVLHAGNTSDNHAYTH